MIETPEVVIDTSVLVGLIDSQDIWHNGASSLRDSLKAVQAQLVYFDCVVNEAVSVLARRAKERKHVDQFSNLLNRLSYQVPQESITWVSVATKRMYREIIDLVRNSSGELNFHDAIIALNCRELGIKWIATFDSDFDQITWLERLYSYDGVIEAFQQRYEKGN